MTSINASQSEQPTLQQNEDPDRPERDWAIKIAKAKEARKAGQANRKGKPATLPSHSHGPT